MLEYAYFSENSGYYTTYDANGYCFFAQTVSIRLVRLSLSFLFITTLLPTIII